MVFLVIEKYVCLTMDKSAQTSSLTNINHVLIKKYLKIRLAKHYLKLNICSKCGDGGR